MIHSIVKNKRTYFILGVLFVFVLWEVAKISYNNDYIVPGVEQTLSSLFKLLTEVYTYNVLVHTFFRLIISVFTCLIFSIILALLSIVSTRFKSFIRPIITLFKTLPIAVLIILLLVMLKGNSLYYIVGVVILPLIYEAIIKGFESIDKNIVDEVKMLSNVNLTVVKQIYLPLTLPHVFTSLLQSFGLGLKVLVMAEFIANAKHSIGYEIMLYKDHYNDMSFVYAWSIILILFVLFVDCFVNIAHKRSLV